jgi:hypothetical protein
MLITRLSTIVSLIALGAATLLPDIASARAAGDMRPPSAPPEKSCASLLKVDLSRVAEAPTRILHADRLNAADGLPARCLVDGYVTPQVGFRLALPETGWNGKFIQIGSGGHGGTMSDSSCRDALRRRYACLVSDMGHIGTGIDTEWARGDWQARLDWGFRATHVVTVAGKAIVNLYYGKPPSRSYFSGCSTGGRQALQEIQKFPSDYDGVIAGAPPIRLSDLYLTFAWGIVANRDADWRMLLRKSDLDLLTTAALAKCDMDDGLQDGLISRPQRCSFRPSELACSKGKTLGCLTPPQVGAAEKIYAGPVGRDGKSGLGWGALPGSERQWQRYYLDADDGTPSYLFSLTRDGLRTLFSNPPLPEDWKLQDLNFQRDPSRFDMMQSLYDSGNPDLSRFQQNGGKLLMYIGLNDVSMPNVVIDYYEKVQRIAGGDARAFARLFLLPGVDHCIGGPGADTVDYLSYLEDWSERGIAPDRLVAVHDEKPSPGGTDKRYSRPVFPFPAYPYYDGRGDPSEAASFVRRNP